MRYIVDLFGRRLPWLVLLAGTALAGLLMQALHPGTQAFDALMHDWGTLLVFGVGLLVSMLAALLLHHLAHDRTHLDTTLRSTTEEFERLTMVARRSSNLVVITDAQRRITWVNAAFERLTGYTAAEVMGQSPGYLLQCPTTDRAQVARMRAAFNAGRGFNGSILNRDRSGRPYWLGLDIQPLHDAQGGVKGFVAIQDDITDQRSAEAALGASQAFLHNTGRIAGVGGWAFDLASGLLQWTEQARHFLEAPPGHQPTLAECLALVAPEARAQVQAIIASGKVAVGATWDEVIPIITATGQRLWLHIVAEGEFDDTGPVRIVGALKDITARRALEIETQRSADLLRGAIDTIDEAFVLFDPQDRLVVCNDKYRDVYHLSRHLLLPGAYFEDIVRHSAQLGQYPAAVGRVEAWVAERMALHRSGDTTLTQRLTDGRVLRVLERAMPDGHRVGFRIDITDLTRATEAAEQATRAKSEFIGTISHELRTPLQSVIGFSEVGLHFAAQQPQFRDMFTDILAGGQRMLTLVNALLDANKIDGSPGSLVLKRTPLLPLLDAVVRELGPLAADKQVVITVPDPAQPLIAQVDAFRMQQVLRNVLANALRFAPTGSRVQVSGTDLGNGGVRLTVSDHGPGIPPDELESIFQAFVQSSRTRDGSGGTGLGLTICRKIMAAHGGRIEAGNADSGGACMTLWLPRAEPLPAAPRPATAAPAPTAPLPTPQPALSEATP
jgi:PAS domain S-box-containing protein